MITIISINSRHLVGNEYITYLLKELRKYSFKLVACMSCESERHFQSVIASLVDETFFYNTDIDINRWKDVIIRKFGWDLMYEHERMLLLNDSFFGPIYPLDSFFYEVDNVDFWGMTAHGSMEFSNTKETIRYPRFLQAYFIVINSRMYKSNEFREYINNLPAFRNYDEASKGFEFVFTDYFEKLGFVWKSKIDSRDLESEDPRFFQSPILFDLPELVIQRGYPFVPKIIFSIDNATIMANDVENHAKRILQYIKDSCEYDVGLIYQHLIKNMDIHDLLVNLNLNFVVKEIEDRSFEEKIGVFAYLFYEDLFEYSVEKLSNVPDNADVYIATDKIEKVQVIRDIANRRLPNRNVKIMIHSKRGRDISALLLTFRNFISEYDVICFIHDKKSSQMDYKTVGRSYNEWIWNNMLQNKGYVKGVISILKDNPFLGLLTPPPVYHSTYFHTSIDSWTICYDITKDVAKRLKININTNREKGPDFLGSAFWCKREALDSLFTYSFKENDFPREPMAVDGSFNHAIERIFPYIAQNSGYLSGIIMNPEYASINYNNYKEALEKIMKKLDKNKNINTATLYTTLSSLEDR